MMCTNDIDGLLRSPPCPFTLAERLISLAADASSAGFTVAAEHLIHLADQVLDRPAELRSELDARCALPCHVAAERGMDDAMDLAAWLRQLRENHVCIEILLYLTAKRPQRARHRLSWPSSPTAGSERRFAPQCEGD